MNHEHKLQTEQLAEPRAVIENEIYTLIESIGFEKGKAVTRERIINLIADNPTISLLELMKAI